MQLCKKQNTKISFFKSMREIAFLNWVMPLQSHAPTKIIGKSVMRVRLYVIIVLGSRNYENIASLV